MDKIKTKYSRYGVSEWVTLFVGLIIFILQGIKYALNGLGDTKLEIVVSVIWLLLIIAPLTIVNVIRKARGIDVK